MKALVIEPTKTYQILLDVLLKDRSFETTLTSSGKEGLELIQKESFDLVCTALYLSDMRGIDFCQSLRAENNTGMTVVMFTSEDKKVVFSEGKAAGMTEVFFKEDLLSITKYLSTFKPQSLSADLLSGKILYLESDLITADSIRDQLSSLGLEIDHEKSAKAAYKRFTQIDYDLLIVDVLQDGPMTGAELVREIRHSDLGNKSLSILAVSRFEDQTQKEEAFRTGVDDYVTKPIIKEALFARVKNLLTSKQLLEQIETQQEDMEQMAMKDILTSLYSRTYLSEVAPKYISEAIRHHFPLSIILIDLENFNQVNQVHGKKESDLVLVAVSDLLKKFSRQGDVAARLKGELFLLMLPYCSGENAAEKADLLRQKIEGLHPKEMTITASCGVVQLSLEGPLTSETLFMMAEQALQEAKENGGNLVILKSDVE